MSELVDGSFIFGGSVSGSEWRARETITVSSNPPLIVNDEENGDYIVLVEDVDGERIFEKIFSLKTRYIEDRLGSHPFSNYSIRIPTFPNVKNIDLRHRQTDDLMHRYTFDSEIRPIVNFTSVPDGLLSGEFTIEWAADIYPGQDVRYTLHYSHDAGRPGTWQGFPVRNQHATSYTLNPEIIRGSITHSVIRVIVSDGVNYSVDTSEVPFFVPMKEPEMILFSGMDEISGIATLQLRKGRRSELGVRLGGVDGKHIPEDHITWHSSIDGFVSRGRSNKGNLSVGRHDISVRVEGLDGAVYERAVAVIDVIDSSPAIMVRVGDGSDPELLCNEMEINVDFGSVEIDEVFYGFDPSSGDLPKVITHVDSLPIRYRMDHDTNVVVWAKNALGFTSDYREIVPAYDCSGVD